MSDNKALVRRLVDEVMNSNDLDVLDELCSPALGPKLRLAFTQFRAAFPDWHQELVELVAEPDIVDARQRCTGTHGGAWKGLEPTGRTMHIDEVYFYRITDKRITGMWGLEDTWTRMRQLAGDTATLGDLARRLLAIGSVWIVAGAVVGTSCSDAITQAPAETTTSIVEFRDFEPSDATTGLTTTVNSVKGRCMDFAPSGLAVFSRGGPCRSERFATLSSSHRHQLRRRCFCRDMTPLRKL